VICYVVLSAIGDFPDVWVYTAVMMAALPTATNVFVIGQQYGVWVERASASILLTTMISVVTLTALLYAITTGHATAEPVPLTAEKPDRPLPGRMPSRMRNARSGGSHRPRRARRRGHLPGQEIGQERAVEQRHGARTRRDVGPSPQIIGGQSRVAARIGGMFADDIHHASTSRMPRLSPCAPIGAKTCPASPTSMMRFAPRSDAAARR
jgi:hypothetical protein